jgi:hypothetical protein
MPEPAEHRHAAGLQLRRLRVLVLVDHVLVDALSHEPLGLRLHPCGDEGGHVETRVPVEHQFVVDDLVGHIGRHLVPRQLMPRDRPTLEAEQRRHGEIVGRPPRALRVLECHTFLLHHPPANAAKRSAELRALALGEVRLIRRLRRNGAAVVTQEG